MPHLMVRRSFLDCSNIMKALVRASMVSSKSISKQLALSEDEGLDLRLTDGAQGVELIDASICWSRATVPGLTFSKPTRPPPLCVSIAQVEDHSDPN